MTETVTLWLPFSPTVFGVFLGVCVFMILYWIFKFIMSLLPFG